VVVVGGRAYNRALLDLSVGVEYTKIGPETTFWPSFVKSTSGWFGGRTSVVVPMTGQDMVAVVMYAGESAMDGICEWKAAG
jgi:hypothetical protein